MFLTFLKKLLRLAVFLSQPYYFLLKLLFKFNIKLVYFVTSNLFLYCFYLFSVLFAFYNENESSHYHFFCACFIFYVGGQCSELYLLCKIKLARTWLESFLKKDFLLKHLGDFLCRKAFIMLVIVPVIIFAINSITLYIAHLQCNIELDNVIKYYEAILGSPKNWSPEQIHQYHQVTNDIIFSKKWGIISKIMTNLFK